MILDTGLTLGHFGRFLIAGGIATATQYLLLIVFVELIGIDPVVASAVSFLLAALLNYAINYRFTYRSDLPHRSALPKFTATVLAGLTINTLSMHVFVNFLGVYYLLSQVLATGITLVWNFFVHSMWSFRR